MKLDTSISIISIITFCIFGASFFFNVGVMSQIMGSKFLEEYDDKKKVIEKHKKELFDCKKDVLKKLFCLVPYALAMITCYCVSPAIYNLLIKQKSDILPSRYGIGMFIGILVYYIFFVGEAYWGINEKHIVRKGNRIYYSRPIGFIVFLSVIFSGCLNLDTLIPTNIEETIMNVMHIQSLEEYHVVYIYMLLAFINSLFLMKWITRYIVLIDREIYLQEASNNNFFSFYGLANLILSLLFGISSIHLIFKYSIWKKMNLLSIIVFALLMIPMSILAGQRDFFVTLTRKHCTVGEKLYYKDINGKRKKIKDD